MISPKKSGFNTMKKIQEGEFRAYAVTQQKRGTRMKHRVQRCSTTFLTQFYLDPIQDLIVDKCIVKNIDVSISDLIKMFPKENDGNYHSIPMNHHKLTDTSNEYDDLKTHVKNCLNASMNLSCITFHAVPYTRIEEEEIVKTSEELFDMIDMKSQHNIVAGKGKMVSLQLNDEEQLPDIGNYRIGLVEGLHQSPMKLLTRKSKRTKCLN